MPKTQEIHATPAGLFVDPHQTKVPPGALLTAENVVIRRDGIIEQRPGMASQPVTSSGLDEYQRMIPFDGDLLIHDASIPKTEWYSDRGTDVVDEDSNDISFPDKENIHYAQARNNLYLTCDDGVRKLTASQESTAVRAGGVLPGPLISWTTSGSTFADNTSVRHRFLIKTKDSNNLELRGRVSSSILGINTTGSSCDWYLRIYFSGEETAGDIIELYRSATFPNTVVPDDELFLAVTHVITTAEIAAGSALFIDDISATELGNTLYTSPSQQGINQSNFKPPFAKDIILFKKSFFYLNCILTRRKSFVMDQTGSYQTGNATGAGVRLATCDTTNGSPILENVSDTTGYEIGQVIIGDGIPDDSYILEIDGTDVTVSNNATVTDTAVTIRSHDTVSIGTASSYETVTILAYPYWNVKDLSLRTILDSSFFASYTEYGEDTTPYDHSTITIETRKPNASIAYVWGTHGESYLPELTGPTESGGSLVFSNDDGIELETQEMPNGVMWSKTDQPEHVPEVNHQRIGSEAHPILKGIVTRDALFIFKKDGIWRLTGSGAISGWHIDEFDLSHILIRPDACALMADGIYAWTNQGVVRINDAGIINISSVAIMNYPMNDRTFKEVQWDLTGNTTETLGVCAAANLQENEFLLGVPEPHQSNYDYYKYIFVYNVVTRAWTTWNFAYEHIIVNPDDNLIYLSGDNPILYKERRSASSGISYYDDSNSKTISDITGNRITFSAAHGASVGDIIYKGENAIVTNVVSSTVVDVNDSTGMSTGTASVRNGYDCVIEWQPKIGGNPSMRKFFMDCVFTFDDVYGIYSVIASIESSLSTTPTTITEAITRQEAHIPRVINIKVPAAHARSTHVTPKITIHQAACEFKLSSLALTFKPMDFKGLRQTVEAA